MNQTHPIFTIRLPKLHIYIKLPFSIFKLTIQTIYMVNHSYTFKHLNQHLKIPFTWRNNSLALIFHGYRFGALSIFIKTFNFFNKSTYLNTKTTLMKKGRGNEHLPILKLVKNLRNLRHLAASLVHVGEDGMKRCSGWFYGNSIAPPMRRLGLVPVLSLTKHGLEQVIYSISPNLLLSKWKCKRICIIYGIMKIS